MSLDYILDEVSSEEQQENIQPFGLVGEHEHEQEVESGGSSDTEEKPQEEAKDESEEVVEVLIEGIEYDAPQDNIGELRRLYRQLKKENKELKQGATQQLAKPALIDLPKRPTLEECDYDEEVFDKKASEWLDKKISYDAQQKKLEQEQIEQSQKLKDAVRKYETEKKSLNIVDYESSEERIAEHFNDMQIGILLNYTKTPAALVYAIGKSSQKIKELSTITDPILFAKEVGKLETMVKISKKKSEIHSNEVLKNGSTKQADINIVKNAFKNGNIAQVMRERPDLKDLFYNFARKG